MLGTFLLPKEELGHNSGEILCTGYFCFASWYYFPKKQKKQMINFSQQVMIIHILLPLYVTTEPASDWSSWGVLKRRYVAETNCASPNIRGKKRNIFICVQKMTRLLQTANDFPLSTVNKLWNNWHPETFYQKSWSFGGFNVLSRRFQFISVAALVRYKLKAQIKG